MLEAQTAPHIDNQVAQPKRRRAPRHPVDRRSSEWKRIKKIAEVFARDLPKPIDDVTKLRLERAASFWIASERDRLRGVPNVEIERLLTRELQQLGIDRPGGRAAKPDDDGAQTFEAEIAAIAGRPAMNGHDLNQPKPPNPDDDDEGAR